MATQQPTPPTVPGGVSAAPLDIPPRGPAFGTRAAIATDHPLTTAIGYEVLRGGGNAVDAALAVSAALVVLKPMRSHLGGDAFVQVRTPEGQVYALNAGGRAPLGVEVSHYADGIPRRGGKAVAVPGLVDAWELLHQRFATRSRGELLRPAIELADEGFPMSWRLSAAISAYSAILAEDPGCREVFLQAGPSPQMGTAFRQPDLARTLERIAAEGRRGFYEGPVARLLVKGVQERGGVLSEEDLRQPQAQWCEPLHITYRGWDVYGQPPVSQCIVTLMALKLLELGPPLSELWTAEAVRSTLGAYQLAYDERLAYLGDPEFVEVPLAKLLSEKHALELTAKRQQAAATALRATDEADTTSFAVVDAQGMMVTFIQSIFASWGAVVLAPGTGVLFNNRMTNFSLDPASPNYLRPGKRTMHTLTTWILQRDGQWYAGGTPGGGFQVQTNLQAVLALVDSGLDLQAAIDAPKWCTGVRGLVLEERFPSETIAALQEAGLPMRVSGAWDANICRFQVVGMHEAGPRQAASDLRGEGCALAY